MTGCQSCACDGERAPGDDSFRRVLWVALVLNAAMFVAEIVASYFAGSVSLQADAIDFFGDSANYAITLFVLAMGTVARARAALVKAATMGGFGILVLGIALHHAVVGQVPEPFIMGPLAIVALAVNVSVAALLFRHRGGDSNRRSVWLCSRNDALGNVAVFAAALGVYGTGTGWPDIAVAAVIATLNLTASWRIIRQVRRELRSASRMTDRTLLNPAE